MIGILILISCLTFFSQAVSDCPNCAAVSGVLTNLTQPRFTGFPLESELANTQIVLSPGNRITYPDSRGEFTFYDVAPGSYRLQVHSLNNFFEPLFVDVIPKGADDYEVIAHTLNIQAKRKEFQSHPIRIQAKGALQYFEIEEEFNILNMAKSGYGLMIGMMILMMFCAKNMPSMDEMEDMQKPQEPEVEAERRPQQQAVRAERRR